MKKIQSNLNALEWPQHNTLIFYEQKLDYLCNINLFICIMSLHENKSVFIQLSFAYVTAQTCTLFIVCFLIIGLFISECSEPPSYLYWVTPGDNLY